MDGKFSRRSKSAPSPGRGKEPFRPKRTTKHKTLSSPPANGTSGAVRAASIFRGRRRRIIPLIRSGKNPAKKSGRNGGAPLRIVEVREAAAPIRADIRSAFIDSSGMTASVAAFVPDARRGGRRTASSGSPTRRASAWRPGPLSETSRGSWRNEEKQPFSRPDKHGRQMKRRLTSASCSLKLRPSVWDESPSVLIWGQRPQKPSRFSLSKN